MSFTYLSLMRRSGSFLPTILLQKNKAIDISTAETYKNFVIIYICGIPGVMLGALMYAIPRIGRKWVRIWRFLAKSAP